jgi:small nuclear ribonucleoprotein (snRNP)-like protein/transcription initiation factor TFIIIB Brf1 subunit/transcription initiation factor TFIIB
MENQQNTFALIIGVGGDLPYSVQDAKNLYASFTNKNLIGYPKKNVIVLTEKQATHDGILKAFDKLKKLTNKDSTIILYYSGHGGQFGKEHKFFLQPNDMTEKNWESTWITADVLKDKINALPSSRLVLFLDCCHAEGMIQAGIEGFYGMAQKLNDDHGIWVMASCQDDQLSWGVDDESIFTKCLLEVLSGKHKHPFMDPEVSMMDVVEYIFDEVPKRAASVVDENDNPCVQTPFFKTQMSENLVLSYFPKNVENNEAIINELEPKLKELDEESFIKLIKAMEAVGRVDDAINALNKNKKTKSDPDLLESLGDLYRNQYLKNKLQKVGEQALDCHQKAYDLAVSTEDEEQIFTNAVKLAFMYAKMDLNKRIMREHATIALKAAEKYFYDSSSKYATMAEASIYLGKLEEAKKHYQKLAEKAGIRLRMQYYEQGVTIYNILFKPENQKDKFIVFLEETLLT